MNLNAAMDNAVTNGKLFSKTPVKCAVGGIYLSVSLADPFFSETKIPYAPIPSASGFGMGFGYLNTF